MCKKSGKTNDPFLRKILKLMDGQTDRQTDNSDLIGSSFRKLFWVLLWLLLKFTDFPAVVRLFLKPTEARAEILQLP